MRLILLTELVGAPGQPAYQVPVYINPERVSLFRDSQAEWTLLVVDGRVLHVLELPSTIAMLCGARVEELAR